MIDQSERGAVCGPCQMEDHGRCTRARSGGVFPAPGGGFAIHCCCVEKVDEALRHPPCPAYPDGKHQPGEDFREWRVAEREGRPIACRCGADVWPVCSTCGEPRVGWGLHDHSGATPPGSTTEEASDG